MSVTSSTFGAAPNRHFFLFTRLSFFLLSPARGRGWVRGLRTIFDAPHLASPPNGGEEHERGEGTCVDDTSHRLLQRLGIDHIDRLAVEPRLDVFDRAGVEMAVAALDDVT